MSKHVVGGLKSSPSSPTSTSPKQLSLKENCGGHPAARHGKDGTPLLRLAVEKPKRRGRAARSLFGDSCEKTVAAIVAAHRAGALVPAQTVARSFKRIRDYDDPALFISLRDEKEAIAEAESLAARKHAGHSPLFGVPVAVKDNIDALGLPTTAGCPAFSYFARS